MGWPWNLFDLGVVVLQLLDAALTVAENQLNLSVVRVLRIVRLLRVIRVVRLLHLFRELRTMAGAVGTSIQPFFWSFCLLALMIFIVVVCILQVIVEHYRTDP